MFILSITVFSSLVAGSNIAFSGEKEGATMQVPGYKVEATTTYSGTKAEYAVREKQEALRT